MYYLRYFVWICLVVQFNCIYAAEQIPSDNIGAEITPNASQAPQSSDNPPQENSAFGSENASPSMNAVIENIDSVHQQANTGAAPVAIELESSKDLSAPSLPNQTPGEGASIELPKAPEPVTPMDIEEKIVEPTGIDTVDLQDPQGNWLFKKIWWEKSKELYGKIRERVDKIVESRMHFFRERTKLDREVLDPFYAELGPDQRALTESVAHLERLLKRSDERESELSEAGKEQLVALMEESAAIAKLSESTGLIHDINKRLDAALEKLMNQINLARSYESEAWQLLNKIAEELNDKKAREYYYVIASLWRNVKEIGNYIQGPFAQHFIQLAQSSVQNVKNVKSIAALLKQKGFALKERVELASKETEEQAEEEEEWPVKKQLSWTDRLWNMITAPFRWLAGLFG